MKQKSSRRLSFGRRLAYGAIAGVAGTGVMTAYQLAVARLRGQPLGTPVPRTWAEAPAPAQVAKKLARAAGAGNSVTKEDAPLLTNVLHWAYGTTWGLLYAGASAGRSAPSPLAGGLGLGTSAWTASYGELVPLGIYKPPWKYPVRETAIDFSYHLVYGTGVAATFALLARRS